MEFPRIAVKPEAAVVVNSVGNVRGLLDFSYEASCSDGVDAACRQEEHVSRLHLEIGEGIGDGIVLHHRHIFLRCEVPVETGKEMGSLVGSHDIPHLGLALGVVTLCGQPVIRVNLDGEVGLGIDELDEQREYIAVLGINLSAHEGSLVLVNQVSDGPAGEFAFGNY